VPRGDAPITPAHAFATAIACALVSALLLAPPRASAQPGPVFAPDSVRFRVDAGLGTDWTNQIFYEQNFDSTAFTGRTTVSEAELRVVGLALARLAALSGRTAWQAANDLRAGPDLVRNFTRFAVQHDASARVRLTLDAEHDWRRDDTFASRREDRRLGTIEAVRWRARDLVWGARASHRFERQRTAEGALALVPDFDYQRFGLDADRALGDAGSASFGYAYATRTFPDTSSRNYREHTASALVFAPLFGAWGLELWADGGVRDAREDSAVGDRFRQGGLDVRLTARLGDRWEAGGRGEARATEYVAPTAAFFDYVLWRWGVFARLRPDVARSIELRPEIELARTPEFGGLPPTSPLEDRLAVAREEYDQWAIRGEYESFRPFGWYGVEAGFGRRDYAERAVRPDDVSAHSDFWLLQAGGFLDLPVTGALRARATADVWSELHDLSSDDLHSLFVSVEVRVPL
jgi:hypothetical protein